MVGFVNRVAELHPQRITFNGSSFDLPAPQRGSAKTGLDTA